jgi:hypothetical protein
VNGTVWKFPIPFEDEFEIEMPREAELLCVNTSPDSDGEQGALWARVVPSRTREKRRFRLRGTGHQIDLDCKYVGSFMMRRPFIFHLFEVIQ